MSNIIKGLKLYIKHRRVEVWYRHSTKEWVVASHVNVPRALSMECRYPSKIKPVCYIKLVCGIPFEVSEINNAVKFSNELDGISND